MKSLFALSSGEEMYTLHAKFGGFKGAVNCIAFSSDGHLMAGGGDDEVVRIWDISTHKKKQVLEDQSRRWGQITAVAWLAPTTVDTIPPIVFGTGRGLVVIYRQTRAESPMVELSTTRVFEPSDPVESMEYDAQASRLAVSSKHGRVTLYDTGRNGTLSLLWTCNVSDGDSAYIARSIRFHDGGRKLLIFVLETADMICHDVQSGKEDWRKVLKSPIGHASICSEGRLLVVHNILRGFDLYDIPQTSPSLTFPTSSKNRVIKDCVFKPVQVLHSAGATVPIQSIDAATTETLHLIAGGSSHHDASITVWKKQIPGRKQPSQGRFMWQALIFVNIIFLILVALAMSTTLIPTFRLSNDGAIEALSSQALTPTIHKGPTPIAPQTAILVEAASPTAILTASHEMQVPKLQDDARQVRIEIKTQVEDTPDLIKATESGDKGLLVVAPVSYA